MTQERLIHPQPKLTRARLAGIIDDVLYHTWTYDSKTGNHTAPTDPRMPTATAMNETFSNLPPEVRVGVVMPFIEHEVMKSEPNPLRRGKNASPVFTVNVPEGIK